jgi:phosphomevalonate kinase
MKRKGNKVKRRRTTRMRKYYPIIFCTGEDKAIAISKKFKFGTVKVNKKDYIDGNGDFLSDEHKIDFTDVKDGEKISCPKCGSPVDFRLFPSDTLPRFVRKKNED